MNIFIDLILWITYFISLYFSVFLLLVYIDKRDMFRQEKSSLETPKTPLVSILIPAYNEEKTILKTIQSVVDLEYPAELLEIIVIDDGSRDRTKRVVTKFIRDKPNIKLISHKNRGKAASMNRALKMAKGEFFACLDADSFVDPKTLRKMLSLYYKENDPSLAIITPAMKVHHPQNLLQRVQWLEYIVLILIGRLASHLDSLYVAPGPFSLYRTDIIRKIGGFDEESITEDQEIAYRVQQHHYKIRQCFDGFVYTTAPWTIKRFYRQRRRWYLGSITCLYKYKGMVANKKYGDFGMMQMVKNVTAYFLAVSGIALAIYLMSHPLFIWLKNLLAINFDIMPFLSTSALKMNSLTILLLDFRKGFIVLFLVGIGGIFFYLAHRNVNEKMMRWGWLPLIPYFLFYYLLKGAILLISLAEFSRNKKVRW